MAWETLRLIHDMTNLEKNTTLTGIHLNLKKIGVEGFEQVENSTELFTSRRRIPPRTPRQLLPGSASIHQPKVQIHHQVFHHHQDFYHPFRRLRQQARRGGEFGTGTGLELTNRVEIYTRLENYHWCHHIHTWVSQCFHPALRNTYLNIVSSWPRQDPPWYTLHLYSHMTHSKG